MLTFVAFLLIAIAELFVYGMIAERVRAKARRDRRVRTIAFDRAWNSIMRRHDKPRRITYKAKDPADRG